MPIDAGAQVSAVMRRLGFSDLIVRVRTEWSFCIPDDCHARSSPVGLFRSAYAGPTVPACVPSLTCGGWGMAADPAGSRFQLVAPFRWEKFVIRSSAAC